MFISLNYKYQVFCKVPIETILSIELNIYNSVKLLNSITPVKNVEIIIKIHL